MAKNKALVTGADGFIGSHLVESLIAKGYQVRALAQYNSFNHWGWLEEIDCLNKVEVVTGDIRDPFFCRTLVSDVGVVFHLAALIAIPFSYKAPNSYVETNATGTLNICQASLDAGVERIVHTSTSEVYGTAQYVPIDEKHPLQPQSPYSASKISADAIAKSYHYAFGLPLTIARPFNTYGPRQSARAVIPSIITQVANGKKNLSLGDLTPTRDLTFVEDTCHGFIALAESQATIGETINIGSNSEISIGDLVNLIGKTMGKELTITTDEERLRPKDSEVFRLWCDNTKLKKLTGFKIKTDLHSGLKKTAAWFSNPKNLMKYKADIYNV